MIYFVCLLNGRQYRKLAETIKNSDRSRGSIYFQGYFLRVTDRQTTAKTDRFTSLAATPENTGGNFLLAEFSENIGTAPYVLELSKERILENTGFRQVWELDMPLESR
jgi:hypothetical protein